jgi:hypothetical protein
LLCENVASHRQRVCTSTSRLIPVHYQVELSSWGAKRKSKSGNDPRPKKTCQAKELSKGRHRMADLNSTNVGAGTLTIIRRIPLQGLVGQPFRRAIGYRGRHRREHSFK